MTYVPQQKANLLIAAAATTPHPTADDARNEPPTPAQQRWVPRWRHMRRRTLVLTVLAATVPVTVTAAVVQLTGRRPPPEPPLPTLGIGRSGRVVPRTALPLVPHSLGDAYARLRMRATAGDRDNAVVRRSATHARQFGLSARQARVLATTDGQRIWLVPGNGFACIGVQAIGSDLMDLGCDTKGVTLKYGLNVFNTENIYGLLPDGVRKIDVTDDTGFHHVESVNDNVYVLAPVSATIRYRAGTGKVLSFRVIA
jgi:hypothetical protein